MTRVSLFLNFAGPTSLASGACSTTPTRSAVNCPSTSARQYLNALEWEHVRLGHCNPELIKYGIKGDIWLGAGVPWTELSNMQMGLCDACMHGRMHALPIYSSLNNKEYDIFEGLSSDYIPYGFSTRSGYTGGYLFTCLASDKPFFVHTKDKTEWKNALIRVINENGPARNPRSRPLRVFQTDYDTVVHSEEFTLWLIEKNVKLQNSAPYKHQQNKAERNIQTIWNMMRASMYYNKAPKSFLEDAIDYSVATYGFLCSVGETRTRDEVFWGQKTDLSQCVPFYASGWYNVTPEEMQYLQKGMKQRIKDKARNCIFLGYTNPYRIEDRTEASLVNSNKQICTFVAFFTENSHNRSSDVVSRKVYIKFFLDDETIEIVEPRLENSGATSGKFLKRHKVFKPDGSTYYKIEDFKAGMTLTMYNRKYTIVDCDDFTKKYFDDLFLQFGYPKSLPNSIYDPKTRPGITPKATKSLKSAIEKEKLKNKSLGFFQYDRKVLRFYGVWDCRSLLFGDDLKVKIHYTLADGSMEIVPVHERNSGRDNLPKFLKRTQIQKPRDDFFETTAGSIDEYSIAGYSNTGLISTGSILSLLGEGPGVDPPPTYHWTDLSIGMVIPVFSLTITIIDADEFTREFYNSKEVPLDPPIEPPIPIYPEVTRGPKQSLIPKEVKSAAEKEKMNLYQGMLLRYKAELNDPKVTIYIF